MPLIVYLYVYEYIQKPIPLQVKPIILEHFNGILFHKSGPANKQYTNHLSNGIGTKKL